MIFKVTYVLRYRLLSYENLQIRFYVSTSPHVSHLPGQEFKFAHDKTCQFTAAVFIVIVVVVVVVVVVDAAAAAAAAAPTFTCTHNFMKFL